jgi:hypothetical protein
MSITVSSAGVSRVNRVATLRPVSLRSREDDLCLTETRISTQLKLTLLLDKRQRQHILNTLSDSPLHKQAFYIPAMQPTGYTVSEMRLVMQAWEAVAVTIARFGNSGELDICSPAPPGR